MAWNSVDFPTLASPTWNSSCCQKRDKAKEQVVESYIRYHSSSCCQVGLAVSSSLRLVSWEASSFEWRMFVESGGERKVEVRTGGGSGDGNKW